MSSRSWPFGSLARGWPVARREASPTEIIVEKLGRLARADLDDEAQRVALLRGSSGHLLVVA